MDSNIRISCLIPENIEIYLSVIISKMQSPESGTPVELSKNSNPSATFQRRQLLRATLFALAAPALGPAFSVAQAVSSGLTAAARGEDGSKALTDPNWKALFFNDHQNQTLITLSDVIIPATDTPGAKEALVNRFIDLLLSVQPTEFQKQFVESLAFLDRESHRVYGKEFLSLSQQEQQDLLIPWAYPRSPDFWMEQEERPDPGLQHFARLKSSIAAAYYGSEIGEKELGWQGEFTNGVYQGCEAESSNHT